MRYLDAINDFIDGVVRWIIIILMLFIPAVMLLQVIVRYLFNYPLPWPEELTRFAFVWLVFMTACAALRRGEVVALDYFLVRINKKVAFGFTILGSLLMIAFLAVAIYSGVDMTWWTFKRGTPSPALAMPWWIVYISLPIGCGLMAYQIFVDLLHRLFDKETQASDTTLIESSE
jgi:TRAP-type C4-dicarboxylate transport system permease small subunit